MTEDHQDNFCIPSSQLIYGSVVYWVTIIAAMISAAGPTLAMLRPDKTIMNPHLLFAAIWKGEKVDTIWELAAGGFPGGHFYLEHFFAGDGFTQFGIVLGSSAALWGLLAASYFFIHEKSYGYFFASLFISAIIIFAMLGVIALK